MQASQALQPKIVHVAKFTRVTPLKALNAVFKEGEHDKIECYRGSKEAGNFGISVHGTGTFVKGHLDGKITSCDYKALYNVYNIADSEVSADYWFITYKKRESHDELKKVFEESKAVTTNISLDFMIEGNDYDINSVYITYEVIRLTINGVSKDYVVTNNASSGAMTPSGDKYPGKFQPV